jgi:hypothetical protein
MQCALGTWYLCARSGVLDARASAVFNLAKEDKRLDVKSKVVNRREAKFISSFVCALHEDDALFRSEKILVKSLFSSPTLCN